MEVQSLAQQFPGAAHVPTAAVLAEALAAHLNKCDAFWMAGDKDRYARHLGYAMERLAGIQALTTAVAEAKGAAS